jgi:transcription factor S
MKFCPKCKSLMIPKKTGGKVIMTCTSCGAKDDKAEYTVMKEFSKNKKKIEVIDTNKEQNLPLTEETCPKCGHKKAYYWMVQTRSADESETKFMRCEKCEHTWRDYS